MGSALDIQVSIPPADVRFFKELVAKMGCQIETKEDVLRKYVASRPKNVKLSDKDIMEAVYSVRYGK